MPDKKQIAFYIDVDNCDITYDAFIHAIMALQEKGEIIIAKVYGVSERKNKDIFDEIARRGYEVAPPMRIKKRGQKIFDGRIVIDVMEDVLQNTNIEGVAIVSPPADMVYLYRRLKSYNIAVYALDNNDEESSRLVDEFLDIGLVDIIKPLPKKKVSKTESKAADETSPEEEERTETKADEPETFVDEPEIEEENDLFSETELNLKEEPLTELKPVAAEMKNMPDIKLSAADSQMSGEFASMLRNIRDAESSLPPQTALDNENPSVKNSDAYSEDEKKPISDDKIFEDVETLQAETSPMDDENAALLDEIKKLLEEFKSD